MAEGKTMMTARRRSTERPHFPGIDLAIVWKSIQPHHSRKSRKAIGCCSGIHPRRDLRVVFPSVERARSCCSGNAITSRVSHFPRKSAKRVSKVVFRPGWGKLTASAQASLCTASSDSLWKEYVRCLKSAFVVPLLAGGYTMRRISPG